MFKGSKVIAMILAFGMAHSAHAAPLTLPSSPARSVTSIRQLANNPALVTTSGQDIMVIRRAEDPSHAKHRFLVQGGLHGDEALTSSFVLWLSQRYISGQSLLNQLPANDVAIDFVPFANPDGARVSSRTNSRGVNLNRNFGILWGLSREHPGTSSFSEAETKALRWLLTQQKYTAAVDVHGYVNWIVAPSPRNLIPTREKSDLSRTPEMHARWIKALQEEQQETMPGYELRTAGGLGDGGAFEDYAFWSAGSYAFCLEMASNQRIDQTIQQGIRDLLMPQSLDASRTDSFLRYERFVFRAFQRALDLKQTTPGLAAEGLDPNGLTLQNLKALIPSH